MGGGNMGGGGMGGGGMGGRGGMGMESEGPQMASSDYTDMNMQPMGGQQGQDYWIVTTG